MPPLKVKVPSRPSIVVEVDTDVYFALLTHALTTEEEEVMGLLLGYTVNGDEGEGEGAKPKYRPAALVLDGAGDASMMDTGEAKGKGKADKEMEMEMDETRSASAPSPNPNPSAARPPPPPASELPSPPANQAPFAVAPDKRVRVRVVESITLMRSDQQRDRVEIGAEQLHRAVLAAESATQATGIEIRVVGWYHSHPHITVHPSHVDLRTQSAYQAMDSTWVGLIASVFNENRDRSQTVKLTAFQTVSGSGQLTEGRVEVQIKPSIAPRRPLMFASGLSNTLYEEEREAYLMAHGSGSGSSNSKSYLERVHASSVYCKALCRLLELHTLPLINALRLIGEGSTQFKAESVTGGVDM